MTDESTQSDDRVIPDYSHFSPDVQKFLLELAAVCTRYPAVAETFIIGRGFNGVRQVEGKTRAFEIDLGCGNTCCLIRWDPRGNCFKCYGDC